MRFAARVWIPGNAWVALLLFLLLLLLLLLLDLVALIMVLPAGVKAGALCDCATISLRLRRLVLWRVRFQGHHVLEAGLCNSWSDRLPDL